MVEEDGVHSEVGSTSKGERQTKNEAEVFIAEAIESMAIPTNEPFKSRGPMTKDLGFNGSEYPQRFDSCPIGGTYSVYKEISGPTAHTGAKTQPINPT